MKAKLVPNRDTTRLAQVKRPALPQAEVERRIRRRIDDMGGVPNRRGLRWPVGPAPAGRANAPAAASSCRREAFSRGNVAPSRRLARRPATRSHRAMVNARALSTVLGVGAPRDGRSHA
jgi:hypothetical protein